MVNKIFNEPCLETIKRFEPNSIDCVITSPPYWQLRDYGYNGQWGLEPTFQLYLEHLWEMMDGIYKVLKPSGTVWINLGDTYGGSKKGNDDVKHNNSVGNGVSKSDGNNKSLLLLPHRFAIGCYDRGWLVRNDIIWAKRNGMPGPVLDRFSKKHEYFFFMTKSEKYFFDMEGIRDKSAPLNRWGGNKLIANGISQWDEATGQNSYRTRDMQPNGGMKNPGSVSDFWDIPTKPSSEEHYASYNDELLKKPIIAGCPKGGLVYDPFMGTGTTAKMCIRTGRNFIGSEMSEKYYKDSTKIINRLLSQTVLL